nr:Inhibitor of Bruton tyrosine kinase [Ipomoea batatas]
MGSKLCATRKKDYGPRVAWSPSKSIGPHTQVSGQGVQSAGTSGLCLLYSTQASVFGKYVFKIGIIKFEILHGHVALVAYLALLGVDSGRRNLREGWSAMARGCPIPHTAARSALITFWISLALERLDWTLLANHIFSMFHGVVTDLGSHNVFVSRLTVVLTTLHLEFVKSIAGALQYSFSWSSYSEVHKWVCCYVGALPGPRFAFLRDKLQIILLKLKTLCLQFKKNKIYHLPSHHETVNVEELEVLGWANLEECNYRLTVVTINRVPLEVVSIKYSIIPGAAAYELSVVVSVFGTLFSYGLVEDGESGWRTGNAHIQKLPCKVDSLHGSVVKLVSAAKFHSVAVTSRGEVYTWGFGRGGRLGHPDFDIHSKNGAGFLTAFHRKHVVAIAAGTMHSIVLIDDGALFYWVSADPDLQCRQLYSFCGRDLVSISAGKYWTAAVTVTGDVYMWDGKKDKDKPPSVTRLHGVKKATTVSVGETHLLIISSLYHPVYPSNTMNDPLKLKSRIKCEIDELDEGFMFDDRESNEVLSTVHKEDEKNKCVPSLKSLCEKLAAEYLVEPRSAIQLLEIADSLGADDLRKHCEDIAIRNLDYILTVSGQAFANTSLDILVRLEKLLDLKSSEPWSCRRLPTPTAPFPAIMNSEEETSDNESLRIREYSKKRTISKEEGDKRLDNFLQTYDAKEGISKQVRALRKKLQQIEMLEEKQSKGQTLDAQQIAKLQTKSALEHSLSELGVPIETLQTTTSISVTGKPTKELEASKRQRRKNKQKPSPLEVKPSNCEIIAEPSPEKGCLAADISQANYKEDKHLEGAASSATDQDANESPFCLKKGLSCSPKGTKASPVVNKKKNRKGGLSMFLSGALDDVPKVEVPPPISPKVEGPAWGGAKIAKGSTSLREIQNEQSKIKQTILVKSQDHLEELSDGSNSGRVQLSSYLSSSPVAVASARTTQVSDVERNTPPWATSGTSPLSRPSLRDIQLQQVRHYHGLSQSPKAKIAGFSLMSGQGSPSDSSGMNRWFKPEVEMPSSIRSIQIEERAIKDLKRFYSSVKVVKNQS